MERSGSGLCWRGEWCDELSPCRAGDRGSGDPGAGSAIGAGAARRRPPAGGAERGADVAGHCRYRHGPRADWRKSVSGAHGRSGAGLAPPAGCGLDGGARRVGRPGAAADRGRPQRQQRVAGARRRRAGMAVGRAGGGGSRADRCRLHACQRCVGGEHCRHDGRCRQFSPGCGAGGGRDAGGDSAGWCGASRRTTGTAAGKSHNGSSAGTVAGRASAGRRSAGKDAGRSRAGKSTAGRGSAGKRAGRRACRHSWPRRHSMPLRLW